MKRSVLMETAIIDNTSTGKYNSWGQFCILVWAKTDWNEEEIFLPWLPRLASRWKTTRPSIEERGERIIFHPRFRSNELRERTSGRERKCSFFLTPSFFAPLPSFRRREMKGLRYRRRLFSHQHTLSSCSLSQGKGKFVRGYKIRCQPLLLLLP